MNEIKLTINGLAVTGTNGQTILEIAKANGIDIPNLCNDERVAAYGACGVCVVEAEGSPRLLRACSTLAAEGMAIHTETENAVKARKTALELLFSDHSGDCRPPCALACPAGTDCQGYVGLIANGEVEEALRLTKEKIPLPGSIGRVCPHPCEDACRRKLVEEPISIAALKYYAADKAYSMGIEAIPDCLPATGKTVAVVGGGPGGLSAAYFLAAKGHDVTIFEAMPLMGGMLRYGIPEYRLPKAYLQKEIDAIEKMGVKFQNNVKLGRDIALEKLRAEYDAVILAVGAWKSMGLGCPGEELSGVLGGIDFLRDVAEGDPAFTRGKVAVVGGGNTAMDACRTAVRLGAERVYNIYRRTKNEMPAEEIEIHEAEEEGVIFRNLTNPAELCGENGAVKAVRLQIMELGEPDASGRRAPVPVEGEEELLSVDYVIVAIGQTLDPAGLEGLTMTRRRTLEADEATCLTNLEGVFAIGDAVNKGAGIAIEAIAGAGRAAEMAHRYLNGESLERVQPYLCETEPTEEVFADRAKTPRAKMPCREARERATDFIEVNLGFSDEAAKAEASRCLECGCMDYYDCKLAELAARYTLAPQRLTGAKHQYAAPNAHPHIKIDPAKCILCGLCVRVCDEVAEEEALGLAGRGFDTQVLPALGLPLGETTCTNCGLCAAACPTGALMEILPIEKQVPLKTKKSLSACSLCEKGCGLEIKSAGKLFLGVTPYKGLPENAVLCDEGLFRLGDVNSHEELERVLAATK